MVWAGDAQAQAGRLVVKAESGETARLELDVLEVNEGALDDDDAASHKNAAYVPIVVTATRLDTDGEDLKDNDDLKRMRINLGSIVGSGMPSVVEDRLVLALPTGDGVDDSEASLKRFSISMPILVIDAKKATGTATISFVPHQDMMPGNDDFDNGRGTSADSRGIDNIAGAARDLAKAAADLAAVLGADPAPEAAALTAAEEAADEAVVAAIRAAAEAARVTALSVLDPATADVTALGADTPDAAVADRIAIATATLTDAAADVTADGTPAVDLADAVIDVASALSTIAGAIGGADAIADLATAAGAAADAAEGCSRYC